MMNLFALLLIAAVCAIAAVWMDVRMLRAVATRLLARAFYLENISEAKCGWADKSHHYRLKLRMAYGLDEAKQVVQAEQQQ
jgi:hypothetical protein